jgi:hypothetical protein
MKVLRRTRRTRRTRMKKNSKTTIEVDELEKLTCDCCGKTDIVYSGKDGFGNGDVYVMSFSHDFGYGSPNDQDTLEFDICEDCLMELFKDKVKYRIQRRDIGECDGEV